eukprot:TRINITY_DN5285_c0_g2_i2.p1 TRINITY_DN5285_c0_g2~~TRINITY_DN5285_c0_g2_i2.p1  ORF type:complete len:887 (+),score=125.48 TRINITY_DN5285_c0_g2_i2:104-2662(+)
MVAAIACGCGVSTTLPKRIRRDVLEDLTIRTKLTQDEVKALYARYRRLAPNGHLLPEQFKQTMGMIGLTDDAFLPDRMFQVFDIDKDGRVSFVEFATSLAVMIRGTEDEKLKFSFDMTCGTADGIQLEDFHRLIRACNSMLSSLVDQNSKGVTSDEEIERLFHDLSSDEGEGGTRQITLEQYKAAAGSNDEFLHCLGLDSGGKRIGGIHSPMFPSPSFSSQTPAPAGGAVVSAAQLEDLRNRVRNLRQAVLRSSNYTGRLSSLPQAQGNLTVTPRLADTSDEDPNERWWTPLSRRSSADGETSLDNLPPRTSMLSEVDVEFEKVMKWCADHEAVARPTALSLDSVLSETPPTVTRRPHSKSSSGAATSPGQFFSWNAAISDGEAVGNNLNNSLSANEGAEYGVGLERSNVHKPGRGGSQEGAKSPTSNSRSSRGTNSGRRRKRHRLLGPKKGLAVHFGHENWNMVLSMMIGIRMSVGRSVHEVHRELQPVDFDMKEKFSIIPRLANVFDSAVSKRVMMTRFIDYAPLVFERIRSSFGIHADEYLRSIGPEQLLGNLVLGNLASLSELSSEGKSGAFFYYTADGNYMMKTVAPKEQVLLKRMLKQYYAHITKHPGTLIVRFLGLHCLRVRKTRRGGSTSTQKLYFVVMGNVFNTPFEIHRRYDLKGSWVGRLTNSNEFDPTVALKDVDFTRANETIRIGPERKKKLLTQIEEDSAFLAENNIIDYSLLLGIHEISSAAVGEDGEDGADVLGGRMTDTSTQPNALHRLQGSHNSSGSTADREIPLQQRELGGMLSSDKRCLYFLGIIDILTPYDMYKRIEHQFKALRHDWRGVSCCPPNYYAKRFSDFIGEACL